MSFMLNEEYLSVFIALFLANEQLFLEVNARFDFTIVSTRDESSLHNCFADCFSSENCSGFRYQSGTCELLGEIGDIISDAKPMYIKKYRELHLWIRISQVVYN